MHNLNTNAKKYFLGYGKDKLPKEANYKIEMNKLKVEN